MEKLKEKQVLQWLTAQSKIGAKWLNLTVLTGIFQGLISILQACILAWIIHIIMSENFTIHHLTYPIVWLSMVLVVKSIAQWAKSIVGFKAGMTIRKKIRVQILEKIATQHESNLNKMNSGEWVLMLQERIERLHGYYALYLSQKKITTMLPLIILIVTFCCSWVVGTIFLVTAPLIPIFMIFVGSKAAEANRKNFKSLSRLSHHFLDKVKGLWTLRLFNRSFEEKKNISQAAYNFRIQTMAVLRLAFLSSTVLEFFASISIALTAVYIGMSYLGYLNLPEWHAFKTPFNGFFLLLIAPEFYQPLRDLGSYYHSKAEAIGAAEPIMEFLSDKNNTNIEGSINLESNPKISICCKNLTVQDQEGCILLDNISFDIHEGDHVCLVGATGSGKTTLLKTLLGLYPYEGSILINNKELRTLNKSTYYENISWLSQKPQLLHCSIADNVSLGTNISDTQIKEALTHAYAMEFVETTPQGINTLVGEFNSGVSIGQAQRIALARSMVRNGNLVLLDEPTASLDQKSETLVFNALQKYVKGKTLLMATHRPQHLKICTKVFTLNHGRLSISHNI